MPFLMKPNEVTYSILHDFVVKMHFIEQEGQIWAVDEPLLEFVPRWPMFGKINVWPDIISVKRLLQPHYFAFMSKNCI